MSSNKTDQLKTKWLESRKKVEKLINGTDDTYSQQHGTKEIGMDASNQRVSGVTGMGADKNLPSSNNSYTRTSSQQKELASNGKEVGRPEYKDIALTNDLDDKVSTQSQRERKDLATKVESKDSSTGQKEGGIISALTSMMGGTKKGESQDKGSDSNYKTDRNTTVGQNDRSVDTYRSEGDETRHYKGTDLNSGTDPGGKNIFPEKELIGKDQTEMKIEKNRASGLAGQRQELGFSNEAKGGTEADSIRVKSSAAKPVQTNLANDRGHRRNSTIGSEATMIQGSNKQRSKTEKIKPGENRGTLATTSEEEPRILDTGSIRGTVYQEVHGDHLEAAEPTFSNEYSDVMRTKIRKSEMIRKQRLEGIPRSKKHPMSGSMGENFSVTHRTELQADNQQLTTEENTMAKQSAKAALRRNEGVV